MTRQDFIQDMQRTHAPIVAMVEMVPEDKLDWAPGAGFMTVGQVLKHLTENWCLVKMMVSGEWPFNGQEEMAEALKLENMQSCSKTEALAALEQDLAGSIAFLENDISEEDFFSKVVSAPWGFEGEIWKGVIMMKDHFVNHKMQLHIYLKMLGQPVHTGTLYGM